MKSIKTIVLSTIVCLTCITSFAKPTQKPITEANSPQMCMPQNKVLAEYVDGMEDDDFQSIFRSSNSGAAIQYIIYSQETLDNTGINQEYLAQDVNYFGKHTAQYFLEEQKLKGSLYVLLMLYPAYNGAYQYPLEEAPAEAKQNLKKVNQMIEKNSECNKEGFCTLFSIADIKYMGSTKNDQAPAGVFNHSKYLQYINEKNQLQMQHYPTKTKNLEPVVIVLVISTNGHYNAPEDVQDYLLDKFSK